MNTHAVPQRSASLALRRVAAAVRTEYGVFAIAAGVVGLHVADDSFLQPNPGVSAIDHLPGGLVLLALVAAAALTLNVVAFTVTLSYVITHVARAHVPAADLGAPYENVEFATSDGLT